MDLNFGPFFPKLENNHATAEDQVLKFSKTDCNFGYDPQISLGAYYCFYHKYLSGSEFWTILPKLSRITAGDQVLKFSKN